MDFCMPKKSRESPQLITDPQTAAVSSNRTWPGYFIVAIIMIGVALQLYFRGNLPGSAVPPAPLTASVELPGFVEIPAGQFTMGSDKTTDPLAFDNERWSPTEARGTVNLPAFYIGRNEITVSQFEAFVAATGRKVDAQALASPPTHPVAFVSWPDALAYCGWLEGVMKDSPNTPRGLKERLEGGWHVMLPSEAEWEKAARGPDGRRYPWGNEAPGGRANLRGQGTVPVGSISCGECAYGLSDMSGNVWEWTRSPYQPYPYDPADDNTTIGSDALWVMRGGAFNDNDQMGRTTTRGAADPGARRAFIGFRVVISRN